MAYMLMMIEPLNQRQTRTEAEGRAVYDRMVRFGQDLHERGLLIASESLRSHTDATQLQVRNGRMHLIDGPYAEAKEMVGGFFLINCKTRQEALDIAAQCPAAEWCTVEVRETAPCYVESLAAAD
ncbi:YciI family protein [Roseateles toxinivorans]|uniref:YCII-related domain-containing protein n=1 Tax=Roseateles toxinivorans TaxID=270368 RepID=A0A4R6QIZ0_9BURK|nr:YciI family protein [Roseateles toxinivorans]TDP61628.1 hypothetical protein DES47_11145 [Roseateles toxinivorans]